MGCTKGIYGISSIQGLEECNISVKVVANRYKQSEHVKKMLERATVDKALPLNTGLKVDVKA